MKNTILSRLAFVLVAACAARGEDVVNPAKRQASLAAAKEALAMRESAPIAKDPFHSEAYAEALAASTGRAAASTGAETAVAGAATTGPRSNRDVLQTIAMTLKPRYMEVGGKPILFFGQKRVNPGGSLTINFEGSEYTLEIVSIDKPNFTLRLNREEFTRPIK